MTPDLFLALANSMLQLITKMIDSQPPDVQKQLWEWYVRDIAWWRTFLKID